MFKREMKINFKSFLVWTLILIGIFTLVFCIYPSIMSSENAEMIKEMMKVFPEEMLKAFNMDISEIDTAFGWLKSEGYVFILLITGIYSAILGSNILLKEENDKTIEYLNSLPVTRDKILFAKISSGIIYISLMVILLGLFNFIGLSLIGNFDKKIFLYLSIAPLFSSFAIFAITLFLSSFFRKTKKTIAISLGIVFISYFLQVFSSLSDNISFLKYFSVFTITDARSIIINSSLNIVGILLGVLLTIILIILTKIRYNKKELV